MDQQRQHQQQQEQGQDQVDLDQSPPPDYAHGGGSANDDAASPAAESSSSSSSSSGSREAPPLPAKAPPPPQYSDTVDALDVHPPILGEELLFVGGDSGHVVALNKSDGLTRWSALALHDSRAGPSSSLTAAAPPSVGTALITAIHPHPPTGDLLVAAGSVVAALSASDGILRWSTPLTPLAPAKAAHAQAAIALPPPDRILAASPEFSPTQADVQSVPSQLVYVGSDYHVSAVDASNGNVEWTFKTTAKDGCSDLPALLVEDGVLFVAGDGRVWALDAFTGMMQRWKADLAPTKRTHNTLATLRSTPLCQPPDFDPTAPRAARTPKAHTLYASFAGRVVPLDAPTGNQTHLSYTNPRGAEFDLTSSLGKSPATALAPLPASFEALAAAGRRVVRFRLANGAVVWSAKLPAPIVSATVGGGAVTLLPAGRAVPRRRLAAIVAAAGGSKPGADLAFALFNGVATALRLADGAVAWSAPLPAQPPAAAAAAAAPPPPPRILADVDGLVFAADYSRVHCITSKGTLRYTTPVCKGRIVPSLATASAGAGAANRSDPYAAAFDSPSLAGADGTAHKHDGRNFFIGGLMGGLNIG
ncbi:hypothetical protein DFJ73DRAFT_795484 [Zopfochytrium polystomum]|nr:hypothetical protein DFJ73DRAFT_795484 [Zopfochytrium polystomum]